MNVSPAIDRVMQGGTPARDLHQMNLRECQQFAKELRDVLANYELALAVAGNWKRRFEALEARTSSAPTQPRRLREWTAGASTYRVNDGVVEGRTESGAWIPLDMVHTVHIAGVADLIANPEEPVPITEAVPAKPAHNCGAQGFDPWQGDKCLGCEAERAVTLAVRDDAENVKTLEEVVSKWMMEQWPAYSVSALDEATAEVGRRLRTWLAQQAPREVPERIKQALVTLAQAWEVLAKHASHMHGAFNNAHNEVVDYIAHLVAPQRLTVQEHVGALVAMGAKRGCGLGALSVPLMSPQGVFAMTVEASRCLVLPEVAK